MTGPPLDAGGVGETGRELFGDVALEVAVNSNGDVGPTAIPPVPATGSKTTRSTSGEATSTSTSISVSTSDAGFGAALGPPVSSK
jgi:hypothetical protein